MEKLYRITYNNEGIYNALKNKIDLDTWKDLLRTNNFNWLPKPPSYAINNKSYFKEKGYLKFKEDVLPIIIKYLDKDKIIIKEYNKVKNVIYEDEFQIVVSE